MLIIVLEHNLESVRINHTSIEINNNLSTAIKACNSELLSDVPSTEHATCYVERISETNLSKTFQI